MTFYEENSIKYKLNFKNCSATVVFFDENAENIMIPNSINYRNHDYFVKSVKRNFMDNNKKLKSISFSSTTNIKIFDDHSFSQTAITEISMPDSVVKIGPFAFCWCKTLQKINISPNSQLRTICGSAFVNASITSLYFPSCLATLQNEWCDRISKLNNITISPDNHNFIFYQDKYILGKSDTNSDIYDVLIFSRRDIEEAIIPSFITKIGPCSFENCINIQTVEFEPDSQLKTIESSSFHDSSIKTIKIPSKTEIIDDSCFSNSSLQKVDFGSKSKLKTISSNCFGKTKIEEISIPSSITCIENSSFCDCTLLKRINFEYNKNSKNCIVESSSIDHLSVTHLVFPQNYVFFNFNSIQSCHELSFIEFLGDNLKILGCNFINCPKLIVVSFPNANKVTFFKQNNFRLKFLLYNVRGLPKQRFEISRNCTFYFKPNANVVLKNDYVEDDKEKEEEEDNNNNNNNDEDF